MSCTAPNDSVTEPLHQNAESTDTAQDGGEKPAIDDAEQVSVSLLVENRPVSSAQQQNGTKIKSYAIEPQYQNTMENPYRETTVTVPHLVKKVPQDDLTPRPWKTFNQILLLSYISIVFCMCFGVFANRDAWKAKLYNGKGLYGLAQKRARRAAILSYVSIGAGFLIIFIVIIACTV
ncbi:hypothetical protein FSP39_018039 [Pinctada imbricata]|uniref:Uncharacterized protein n=1 Tax=Pinctada imbricata TaxID=66713 RepID=A0AA89BXQ7_PINIB|nr:hypothetical protein FSP39_018039 [Pinctada imbricata]